MKCQTMYEWLHPMRREPVWWKNLFQVDYAASREKSYNSSEYISPGDGTYPARFHSGCWSLLADSLMGRGLHTRLACEGALEFKI